jgi:TetR/AcrR family transcriptional repressor of nem operon
LTIFEDRILAQPEISGQIDPDMITINAMARHKEFDRDVALVEAIKVFASHGYEGASTETLLRRMRISRHSMYGTFGDKRRLYLEALQQYGSSSTAKIISAMHRFTTFFPPSS